MLESKLNNMTDMRGAFWKRGVGIYFGSTHKEKYISITSREFICSMALHLSRYYQQKVAEVTLCAQIKYLVSRGLAAHGAFT